MIDRQAVRHWTRCVVLAVIAVFSLGYVLLALTIALPGHAQPVLCIGVSDGGTVLSDAGCNREALQRYHVTVGSRLDIRAMTPAQRVDVLWPHRGRAILLPFAGNPDTVVEFAPTTLRADPAMTWLLIARIVALAFCLAASGILVLVRPTPMTWAFYLFSAFSAPAAASHPVLAAWHPIAAVAGAMLWQILLMLAAVAFLVFVIRFPDDAPSGWLAKLERFAPAIFAVAAIVAIMPSVEFFLLGNPAHAWTITAEIVLALIYALAVSTMVIKFAFSAGADRHKLAFVLCCLVIGFGGFIADVLLGASLGTPSWVVRVFGLLSVIVPVGVVYAVLRHRVIDVRIVISHTLTYGAVGLLLLLVFGIIHYVLEGSVAKVFHGANSGTIGVILDVVLGVGIIAFLNAGQERTLRWIENRLFRTRRAAEQRLALLATHLPEAGSLRELAGMLTREPFEAMRLTSAAAFFDSGGRRFRRLASYGWHASELREVDAASTLVSSFASVQRLAHVNHATARGSGVPQDDRRPEIVLPLAVRGELVGFVFYGAHDNGAALDHEERTLLASLAPAAGAAYDHVSSLSVRLRNRALQWEVVRLRRRIGTAISAFLAIALLLGTHTFAAQKARVPNLMHVSQLAHSGSNYEDRATHFTGTLDSHWIALSAAGENVVVGMLDAPRPIAGNSYDVLLFDASNSLLGTWPVPRRPFVGVQGGRLDIRYSVDNEPPNRACCQGDYVDLFIRITGNQATLEARAYGPPVSASASNASQSTGVSQGPGLQQTAAGPSGTSVVSAGIDAADFMAFDYGGGLWVAGSRRIAAIDADSRSVLAQHVFPSPCRITDMVTLASGAAVALSCNEVALVSRQGIVTRVGSALSAAPKLVSDGAQTLWLLDGTRACRYDVPGWRCSAVQTTDASAAAVGAAGGLLLARTFSKDSTDIERVDERGVTPVARVPWQVAWLAWSGGAAILVPARSPTVYVLHGARVSPLCDLGGDPSAAALSGYGHDFAVVVSGQLRSLDASGCNTIGHFPALHPTVFSWSATLLAVGFASSDIVFFPLR